MLLGPGALGDCPNSSLGREIRPGAGREITFRQIAIAAGQLPFLLVSAPSQCAQRVDAAEGSRAVSAFEW